MYSCQALPNDYGQGKVVCPPGTIQSNIFFPLDECKRLNRKSNKTSLQTTNSGKLGTKVNYTKFYFVSSESVNLTTLIS